VADLNEIASLGKSPIPGDNPAGESVQYDPDFEALRAEVQKLDSVTGETVDWGLVITNGTEILKSRSKHLLVAIYLTLALLERDDYAGLACGLGVLRDLIAGFWDTMEPPVNRKRGRIEGFVWLNERAGKWLPDRRPTAGEKDTLAACGAALGEIGTALGETLGDEAPSLNEIAKAIKAHEKELEAAEKAAEKRRDQAAKVSAGEIDGETTADDARKVLAKTRGTIRQICDILRRGNPADPVPYRLLRAMTWAELRDLPPDSDGVTQIPPPPPEQLARLVELKAKQDWAALLEGAETAFAAAPLWLDANHLTFNALEGLGDKHESAAEALQTELAVLIGRLPGLMTLQFAGGAPFASIETQKWIDSEVRNRLGSSGGKGTSGGKGMPEGLAETLDTARHLVARGKLEDAVRRMQKGIAATGEQRARFFWRLELARLCLDAGRVVLANPLLEELETVIERHQLENWEPELCKSVYIALLSARRLLLKDARKATPELVQKTNQLYDRLSRLDPMAVLSLDGK